MKFKKKVYNVTFSVDGGHGTISATPQDGSASSTSPVSVEHGKKVTFTAVPHTGYEVEKWMVGGNTVSGNTSTSYELSTVTEAKNVTVKFKKKTYTVTFSVAAGEGKLKGEYNDGTSHSNTAQNGGGEVKLENVPYGTQVTFTATPTTSAGAWKVADWTKDNAAVNGTNSTYTLFNVTADTTVTVKFYQSEIDGTDPMAWRALLNAVSNAPENATIKINGEIKATIANDNKGEIVINKNLTIKGKKTDGSDTLNAALQSRIFKVKTGKTLTLENITLKNGGKYPATEDGGGIYSEGTLTLENTTIKSCGATNGGGVYVGGGTFEMHDTSTITGCTASKGGGVYVSSGTFKMQDSAIVTPSTGSDQYTAGKNDVYLESGKKITVDGTLSNNPAARITPREYTAGHLYLTGSGVGTHHLKFIVPPQKVTENSENWDVFWYIAADGTLKAEVEDSSLLQEVIRSRPNDTPFIIKLGNIDDLQTVEIPGNKKIMLKADRDVTLTCPNNGHNHYKHLQVQRDATLILEGKIKLQGADYGDKDHYALYVEDGGKAEIKDGVTITGFKNTGRGTVFVDGNLTMSGGTITGNKARNKGDGTAYDDGKGGGVYIAPDRSFTMTGGTIADNEAGNGGGVYVSADGPQGIYGNFIMKGGTIKNNKATVSSVYSYIEYTGHGGGVCTQGNFEMRGGTITGNQSARNCKAVQLEHDFYWYGGDIKDNGGANQTVSGIRAVADRNGGLYYFHNNTNQHKEPS